jgi:hypothetical protein
LEPNFEADRALSAAMERREIGSAVAKGDARTTSRRRTIKAGVLPSMIAIRPWLAVCATFQRQVRVCS